MSTDQQYPSPHDTNLFEENEFVEFDEASTGQRFLNFLIDSLLVRLGLSYGTSYALMTILLSTAPDTAYDWFGEDSKSLTSILVGLGIGIINHLFYYTFCEKLFRGYTLGKLVTGTRAIRDDGMELTFSDAMLRSLSRLVPFEAFSIWAGSGLWHDSWTHTKVIKTR